MARLRAQKPEFVDDDVNSLGARLRRRRRELDLRLADAASMLGVDTKSLMLWEREVRQPADRLYPSILDFLGSEPWSEPQTLGQALRVERRRRGLSVKRAAGIVGIDQGTWLRWEAGEWKPTRLTIERIDDFLGFASKRAFPGDVR